MRLLKRPDSLLWQLLLFLGLPLFGLWGVFGAFQLFQRADGGDSGLRPDAVGFYPNHRGAAGGERR